MLHRQASFDAPRAEMLRWPDAISVAPESPISPVFSAVCNFFRRDSEAVLHHAELLLAQSLLGSGN